MGKTAGADRFLTVDLHNEAESAFFPPGTVLDELNGHTYLADFVRNNVPGFDADRTLVCATNGGGMALTRRLASELGSGFMMADRVRLKGGGTGQTRIMSGSGADTAQAIVVADDMIDTGGALAEVCEAIHRRAPQARIYGVATHGYFSGKAPQRFA